MDAAKITNKQTNKMKITTITKQPKPQPEPITELKTVWLDKDDNEVASFKESSTGNWQISWAINISEGGVFIILHSCPIGVNPQQCVTASINETQLQICNLIEKWEEQTERKLLRKFADYPFAIREQIVDALKDDLSDCGPDIDKETGKASLSFELDLDDDGKVQAELIEHILDQYGLRLDWHLSDEGHLFIGEF